MGRRRLVPGRFRRFEPYIETVLRDSPVYLYPCWETSGTVVHEVAGRLEAVLVGSPLLNRDGPYGWPAIDVNAAGYISAGSAYTLPATQSFEAWVYMPIVFSASSAFGRLAGTPTLALMGLGPWTSGLANEVVTLNSGSNRTGFTGFTLPVGWRHMVLTCDGSSNGWTLYVDGEVTGTKVSSGSGAAPFSDAGIQWGGVAGLSNQAFRFSMIAAYPRTLTATQVAAHYAAMVPIGLEVGL